MYKALKISTIIAVTILFISGLIVLSFQSLVSFIAYPVGALFLYYLVLLLAINSLKIQCSKAIVFTIIWILFLTSIIWLLMAPGQLFNLLMPDLNIDMELV
ncbi:hypothetical protein [Sinomicrobium sp. M5D2P9]